MKLSELSTPVLCVDLDAFERNIERMHGFFEGKSCKVRPHVKAHKTPAIARIQIDAGNVSGLCCAVVSEAEVFADHGFDDLLIANEVCDPTKIDRLRALNERVTLTVAVDSNESAELLTGTGLRVLVDVNIGLPRCGCPPRQAVAVAQTAEKAGLRVVGVMGYEGHVTIIEDLGERAAATRKSIDVLLGVVAEFRDAGIDTGIVSAGSTLSYDVTGTTAGVTEIQAGSYALMDTTFARSSPFEEALCCLTSVLSTQGNIAVLDAGLKTMSIDHGDPLLPDDVAADVLFLSDEHTTLAKRDGFSSRPGDRVWLRPSHVDPTVNLHDNLYAFRGEDVIEVWPVAARGYGAS
ncbi:MAG TPA: alanine racemase [Actinomycetota bacterium]|jgi:D-serine deaminase-like pyridoxal phosphate-dependent protein|nr:alanine racemase [Actinomycetota bacterium]